jgi:hypothetical protein
MRPEPIAVGLALTVAAAASVRLLHEAGYEHAVYLIVIALLLVVSLLTAIGKARAN